MLQTPVLQELQNCMLNSNGDNTELDAMLKHQLIDINAYDSEGRTLFHLAASKGFDDCLYTLFQYGAHLDQVTTVFVE